MALFFQKFWRRQDNNSSCHSQGVTSKLESNAAEPTIACVPPTHSCSSEPATTDKPIITQRMSKRTVPLGRGILSLTIPVKRRKTVEQRWEMEKARTRGWSDPTLTEDRQDMDSSKEVPVYFPKAMPKSALEKWEAFLRMCDKHEGKHILADKKP